MVVERKVIDIRRIAEPGLLAHELEVHPDGLAVIDHGTIVAIVTPPIELGTLPVHPGDQDESVQEGNSLLTPERIRQLLAAVESMEGSIDTDRLHRLVDDSRRHSIELHRQRDDEAAGDHPG